MKKLLIMLVLVLGINLTNAQSAIYVDYYNGSVGYSTGNTNYLNNAYKSSIYYGAKNPSRLLNTNYKGYVCVYRGYVNGRYVFGVGYGYNTIYKARQRALYELNKYNCFSGYITSCEFYGL